MRFDRTAITGLTFLLALSACSDITEPTSPVGSLDRPSYDTYTYGSYELVTGSSWNLFRISNSRVIGAAGGRVNLGLHELVVPAGAVNKPTVFRMSKQLGPHVLVDLSATDKASGAPVDSFARSVELRLSYRFIRISEADLRRAVVLWLKDESASGELVPVPTQVDRRTKHLIGSLTHFSQYAMGLN